MKTFWITVHMLNGMKLRLSVQAENEVDACFSVIEAFFPYIDQKLPDSGVTFERAMGRIGF
jgi:hypothetical protein